MPFTLPPLLSFPTSLSASLSSSLCFPQQSLLTCFSFPSVSLHEKLLFCVPFPVSSVLCLCFSLLLAYLSFSYHVASLIVFFTYIFHFISFALPPPRPGLQHQSSYEYQSLAFQSSAVLNPRSPRCSWKPHQV